MALTQKRTLRGGGALEFLDLRLFEDGGERGGALFSDVVVIETAQSMGEVGRASANAVRGQYCRGRSVDQPQTLIYHVLDSRLNALERYYGRVPLDHTGKQSCSSCTKALVA